MYSSLISRAGKLFLVTGMLLMITVCVQAQGGVENDPDTPVPVDGGVSLLVAAGVGYGVKKWRDKRRAQEGTGNNE